MAKMRYDIILSPEAVDDWFYYSLENDLRFLQRIEKALTNIKPGKGIKLEDIAL